MKVKVMSEKLGEPLKINFKTVQNEADLDPNKMSLATPCRSLMRRGSCLVKSIISNSVSLTLVPQNGPLLTHRFLATRL